MKTAKILIKDDFPCHTKYIVSPGRGPCWTEKPYLFILKILWNR